MGAVIYQVMLFHVPFIVLGAGFLFAMGFQLGQRCEILEEEKRAIARKKCREFLGKNSESAD